MKKSLLLLWLICLAACTSQDKPEATSPSAEKEVTEELNAYVDGFIQHDGKAPVHSILVYARNESNGLEYHYATGVVGRDSTPVTADYQYNIASITKPVVATVILQLEEEGKLSLDDKVIDHLSEVEFLHLDSLHVMDGEAMSDRITIDMLLTHTSGVADIFSDASVRFNRNLLSNPQQSFSPEILAGLYYEYGLHRKPANAPGEGHHYSDINYNLLGLIIEKVTGKTLPQAIRERVLEPLDMNDTYFDYYEEGVTKGKRTDAFYHDINITRDINTSYEWGGGGLVSTTKDMARYMTALMEGKLFEDEGTLEKMLDTSLSDPYNYDYGRGIFKYIFEGEDGKRVMYGHSGFFGSDLAYDPEQKLVIVTHINQSSPSFNTRDLILGIAEKMDAVEEAVAAE